MNLACVGLCVRGTIHGHHLLVNVSKFPLRFRECITYIKMIIVGKNRGL